MKRTEVLQEVRKMRFEEAYYGWQEGRLSQQEAALLLGVCDRSFRRAAVTEDAAQRRRWTFYDFINLVSRGLS